MTAQFRRILLPPCPHCGDEERISCPWCHEPICIECDADTLGADDYCCFCPCGREVNMSTGEKVQPVYMRCPQCKEDKLTILNGTRRCWDCGTEAVKR